MKLINNKSIILLVSFVIIIFEISYLYINKEILITATGKYLWFTPLLFFKSLLKRFLILNFFGILKVLSGLLIHLFKLILIKFFKTIGIRYVTFFSQEKWAKTFQKSRIFLKKISVKRKQFALFFATFNKWQISIVIVAFFPIIIIMILFGFTFRVTREAMVKKGQEISATKITISTLKKNIGLVSKIKYLDNWVLMKIRKLTNRNSKIQK